MADLVQTWGGEPRVADLVVEKDVSLYLFAGCLSSIERQSCFTERLHAAYHCYFPRKIDLHFLISLAGLMTTKITFTTNRYSKITEK